MAAAALAQEKIWLEKSSYDKAECLYHEKISKVLPPKSKDESNIIQNDSTSIELQVTLNTNTAQKSKSKKSKDNKQISKDNVTNEIKKKLKKSNKKEELTTEFPFELSNNITLNKDYIKIADTEIVGTKKNKEKEQKEKKNKADEKRRHLEKDINNIQEFKEQFQGSQPSVCSISAGGSLANEVAKARQHIKQSLQCIDGIAALTGFPDNELTKRVVFLEKDNKDLRNIVQELADRLKDVEERTKRLEISKGSAPVQICPPKPATNGEEEEDVDLFGSDSEGEDAEAAKVREERLAAYAAKKSKKPVLIAKSNIILDVKPWDDETEMAAMEAEVRKIQTEGLLWGAAKLVPVAFNIHKLQISCVVEDDKVSVDWLTEQIQEIEDFVQSVDIAAFNKV